MGNNRSKHKSDLKNASAAAYNEISRDITKRKKSNTDTFNKIFTTVTATYIPGLFYLIKQKTLLETFGIKHVWMLKVSASMLMLALIFTLIALFKGSNDPDQDCIKRFDKAALVLFILSMIFLCVSFIL